MAGIFKPGETKIRPGSYYRYANTSSASVAEVRDGIVAALFSASWGPLNQPVRLTNARELYDVFGTGGNVDTAAYALQGGASEVLAIRIGDGGARAATTLTDNAADSPVQVLTLTAMYVGEPDMKITIRNSASDDAKKEALLYSGRTLIAKVSFERGGNEAQALADALSAQGSVMAKVDAQGSGELALVNQKSFTGGADPLVTIDEYMSALEILEAEQWDVLAADTNETAVHALMHSYIERVVESGLMGIAVVGGSIDTAYDTRIARAEAFDSANVVYVLNGGYDGDGNLVDGYKAAAIVAGMIAAIPANDSLTHKAVPGFASLAGPLTNAQIESCIKRGALVFTAAQSGKIWVELGINTLVNLGDNQDAGWKKIRRTKTRYELIRRINESVEPIVGTISNDANGRATVISLAQGVINNMIAENKLISGAIKEDETNLASGDSAWFVLDVKDLDSIERVYFLYNFSFS